MTSGIDLDLHTTTEPARRIPARRARSPLAAFPDLTDHELRRHLADAVRSIGAERVVDVGCEAGELTAELESVGCHVVAVDHRAQVLENIDTTSDLVTTHQWVPDNPIDADLLRTADVVVSAYLLHSFTPARQIDLIRRWTRHTRLGITLIADIGFPTENAFDAARADLGDRWDGDHNYLCGSAVTGELAMLGMRANWRQVTPSAGFLRVSRD